MLDTAGGIDDARIDSLDKSELRELQARIEAAIARREAEHRQAAIAEVERVAGTFGFALSDLVGEAPKAKDAGKSRGKPMKFADPQDPTRMWSGRGRQPAWFKDRLAEGFSREDLELK